MDIPALKKRAAYRAVEEVRSGMIVGLGHGSTAAFAIERLGELIRSGALVNVRGVPCSLAVRLAARKAGIPLTDLNRNPVIDLTIDGADQVDDALDLIKGGGGALLREKMVAQASRREIIILDESKMTPILGMRRAVPVEVVAFGWRSQIRFLEGLGARVTVRRREDGRLFRTDQGNVLLDPDFGPLREPRLLTAALQARAGIVEHGLFLGLASDVFVAGEGGLRHLVRKQEGDNQEDRPPQKGERNGVAHARR